MANEDMDRHWNEVAGPEWLEREREFDTALGPFGDELLRRSAPRAGEHVLDVGCGFGATTTAIATAVGSEGRVMGLDISAPLLERAKQRAAGATNVTWRHGDAQVAPLPAHHFDLVVSRFGVMFFDDPVAAFANIHAATKPEGRLCVACWQSTERNGWYTLPTRVLAEHIALPAAPTGGAGPFAFADPGHVRRVLAAGGWNSIDVDGFEAPMLYGAGGNVDRVIHHLVRGPVAAALASAPAGDSAAGLAALRRAVEEYTVNGETRFPGVAWMTAARA